VIDIREQAAANPDYQLTKQDVLDWEAQNGQIAPGSFVILFTGWEDRWDHPKAFVGIDTHGVDPGLDTRYRTNTQFAEAHKIAIECMANLDRLPPTGATLVLGPLRLQGGSGSPPSVMAFVP
jgi:kynurenine formamidase